jgi:peroxiredoxin
MREPAPVGSREALGRGCVILFAVPGAFTPTRSLIICPAHGMG